MLTTILLIFALVFFIMATASLPSPPRFAFLPAGADKGKKFGGKPKPKK